MLIKIENTMDGVLSFTFEVVPGLLRALADGRAAYRAEVNLLSGSKLRGWAAGIDAFRLAMEVK